MENLIVTTQKNSTEQGITMPCNNQKVDSMKNLTEVQKRINIKLNHYMKAINDSNVKRHYIKSEIMELDNYFHFFNTEELIVQLLKFDEQYAEAANLSTHTEY